MLFLFPSEDVDTSEPPSLLFISNT